MADDLRMKFRRKVWTSHGNTISGEWHTTAYDTTHACWVCTCQAYCARADCEHIRKSESLPRGPWTHCPICGEDRLDHGDLVVHISQEHEAFCSSEYSPSEGMEYVCICGFGRADWPTPLPKEEGMARHFASQTDLGDHFAESILIRSTK